MKETIEVWVVTREGRKEWLSFDKDAAEANAKLYGGTVVKLTGEMPRKPIERKTVAYVMFVEPSHSKINGLLHLCRLGICDISAEKQGRCQTKVEITVKELSGD